MREIGYITVPSSHTEAMSLEHKKYWQKAMQYKFASLNESNVWKLVILPTNKKAILFHWTFDIEVDSENVVTQSRARLVGKGFTQVEGAG